MTVYISTSIDKNICTILIYKDIDFFCQTEYSTFKKCSWYDFCIMRINYYKDIEKICTASLCEYSHVYIRSRHFLFIIWHFPQLMTLIWCRLLIIFNIFKKISLCRLLFETLTLIIIDYGDFDLAGYFEYSIYFATSFLR